MTNWNQIVFVTKLLLVKDSCNMGANNTITTASSSSSGAPRRPTSFLTRNTCCLPLQLQSKVKSLESSLGKVLKEFEEDKERWIRKSHDETHQLQ